MSFESAAVPAPSSSLPRWTGWYAAWGMPLAYALLFASSAMGLRLPAMGLKLAVGGGAFLFARKHLKDHPADAYALAVRKVVRMQIVVMLLIELGTLAMVFVLPMATLAVVAFGVLALGVLLHCAIGVWGTLRLHALARSAPGI